MFCTNETGSPISYYTAQNSTDEARWIVSEIKASGKPYSDFAVIYRTNVQSRLIEQELTKAGVGYTIFGSQSFYTRKEVRDLIAYCKAVINPNDEEAFRRVLGTLKGVGKVTINNMVNNARAKGLNMHCAIKSYANSASLSSSVRVRLSRVDGILNHTYTKCSDIINDVLFLTEYRTELRAVQTEETIEKLAIIDEFEEMVKTMEANNKDQSMVETIDQISTLSDAKGAEKEQLNAVKLMTAHASKGLEFENVFIIGTEEGSFPHANAINTHKSEAIEEERRLFYVAMTRAKKHLYITNAKRIGNISDGFTFARPSRFIKEIPSNLIEEAF